MRAMVVISIGMCISMTALVSALAADGDKTPLNVKPGLWEITSQGQNSGTPPIPADALARLSPDQRAQMEAHMKDMMAKQAQRRVAKRCLTQKEIDQGFDKIDQVTRGQCTQNVTASTATLREGSIDCAGATTSSGTYHFEAPSPESFSGNWDMTTSNGDHVMQLKNTMSGKWLSADCGTAKPGGNN